MTLLFDLKIVNDVIQDGRESKESPILLLSYAEQDFGVKFNRSYFETSHAKGVQDAAGGLKKKNMADRAVTKGDVKIQNAQYFYDFCNEQLTTVKKSGGCKRRVFKLLHTINRNRKRYFKPVANIRSIHQVISTENGHQNKTNYVYIQYLSRWQLCGLPRFGESPC